jgi:glycosyltransferase involved in cell wall biosynthesis
VPRWRATLDGEVPTVLFLGVLREAKGVLELVQAWPRVLAAVPGARLVLGGSGDLAAVSAAVRAAGVESSVEFPGWVGGAEKERLLRNAWVLALPSHVPVVASAVGAIPRAVEHGRSGLLIAPRDPQALAQALISLLTDGEQRKAMGANARRRAEECFSADALVPQLEALWRRVGRARADFPIPFKGRSGSS